MVSTHILYNDWGATGTGTIPLTKLPFIVLSQVSSMDTLETDLGNTLSNMYVPQAMVEAEYLIQVLVTDGTTTYVLRPGSAPDQSYEAIDITNNPKLTNFRWVDQAIVERNGSYMQNRPTGVERWNEIDSDTTLEDLRFTLAYEAPTRLSEFIGIDETTKSSTDAELEAIYDEAHAEYLIRQRDGKLWQTMHSVVYGPNGIERLYVQEDWDKDYAYATREYVDEVVEAVEGEIPELLGSTGQSTVAGMTQKAITDALASAGGGVKVLTSADYNYPASNPTSVALWLLDDGFYTWGYDIRNNIRAHKDSLLSDRYQFAIKTHTVIWDSGISNIFAFGNARYSEVGIRFFSVNDETGKLSSDGEHLIASSVVDNLTSTYASSPLSANQGKVLKDLIDSLVIKGSGAPTTSTVGTVGKLYEDTTNGKLYQCTAVSGSTYTWTEVGGGGSGVNVVQTTGTSTTDVMSQKAVTDSIFVGNNRVKVNIGKGKEYIVFNQNSIIVGESTGYFVRAKEVIAGFDLALTDPGENSTYIGYGLTQYAGGEGAYQTGVGSNIKLKNDGASAFGYLADCQHSGSMALGGGSKTSFSGEVNIAGIAGSPYFPGYSGTKNRVLSGVYPGFESDHAATYGQIQALEARIAALEAQLGNA